MKITRILLPVELPLHEGRYSCSGGKSVDVFDSTVVRVETDKGLGVTPLTDALGEAVIDVST